MDMKLYNIRRFIIYLVFDIKPPKKNMSIWFMCLYNQ